MKLKNGLKKYTEVLEFSEVGKYFNVPLSTVYRNLILYKETFKIKFKDEIQKELLVKNKRLCLPLSGCGKIKDLNEFYFREDSGKFKEQCKSCRKKYQDKWNRDNREYLSNYNKNYGRKNRKKISAREKERIKNNIQFRLIKNIRSRVSGALKGKVKFSTCKEYLGCFTDQLLEHLEKNFYFHPKTREVMSWDNYGFRGWHVDHIIPLSSFDLTIREELLKACHYTNLQPLWAEDNLTKSDKVMEIK